MSRRICFVGLDNYPVLNPQCRGYFGGESVQQTLLARAFQTAGYGVSMVVIDYGQPDGEVIDGIQVLKAYGARAGLPVIRFAHPRLTGIMRALAEADADVYYQSCAGAMTGFVAWFCHRRSRQFVFRLAHDTDVMPGQQLIGLQRDRLIYEYGLRRADVIAAQSRQQMELLARNYGLASVPVDMVVEIPDRLPAGERDIDVLWVNNLRDFKRPDWVLDIARALPDVRFCMIGGAVPGNEGLAAGIAQEAEGIENLQVLGAVPYHEVNEYFGRARLFLNTSSSEGFPNSYLQAWARGTPVVACFDPDRLIEREGMGWTAPDQPGLVECLDRVLRDEPGRGDAARRGRAYVLARHSGPAIVAQYEACCFPERASEAASAR
jgi:glycosyltransferase involved in cell wall biosynthesis